MQSLSTQNSGTLARWSFQDARCCAAPRPRCIHLDKLPAGSESASGSPDLIKAQLDLSGASLHLKHDLDAALQLQEFVNQGRTIVAALYTYRSTAKTHFQSVNHDSGLNNALQQSDTYTTALALAASAQQFCIEAGEALIMIFVGMVAPDGINVLSSQALLRGMTMLFDQMHVLDTLKAAKVSLADDIAIARHAHQQSSSNGKQQWEEDTDFDGLLEFLEDPWACVKQMHSCIKQVNYQHRVVARLVQYICDSLVEKENTAPQVVGLDSHAFLRALPVALYLLFPYEDGKLGLEAIGNKQLHRGLKLLKQKPVVPAVGDLPLPLMHILHQLSSFLVAHGQENKEGIVPADQTTGRRHMATSHQYNLQQKAASVVASHDAFTAAFAGYAVQMADYRMTNRPAPPQLLQQGLLLATEGLKNLSTWSAHLRELHSWKLTQTQPSPLRRVNVRPAASGRVPQSPRQLGVSTGSPRGQWAAPPPYPPTALDHDQSLRQQFAHQDGIQTDDSMLNHCATPLQQQTILAHGVSSQLQPQSVPPQGYQPGPTHMTASPQLAPAQSSASLATAEAASADGGGSLQQLSPSQRRAQSSVLFAAVAAATQPQPKAVSETGEHSGQVTSHTQMHAASSITTGVFTTPAAQAARTFASPGPSPSYSPHPQLASNDSSSAGLRATEHAASPVSPQAATEAAVLAMRSEITLYGGTDARDAQTDGSSMPPLPTASMNRDFDPVPFVESSPAVDILVRGLDSVPAPVSIPTPSVTVSQEPLSAQSPKAETAARSMPADYKSIQQTDLAVPMAPQAPTMLRPVGAFSYTAPAAATRVPPSTDRYIPAIGFSPSRARVARDPPADPPADPFLGHAPQPSYTVEPLPAVPQQTILSTSSDAPAVYQQKAVDVPPVFASTMSAAPMDHIMAQPTGAVYGPGVTSTPIATDAAISSHPAMNAAAAPVLTQTAPTGITFTAGPSPVPPVEQVVKSTGHLGKPTRQLHGIGFVPADVAQLPMLTTAAGIGSVPSPVLPTGPQEAAPFSPPGGLVLSGLAPESQGIAPGPLQAGQTMPAGPVAEGTQHSLQASDSDAWSDADSVTTETLSETRHERSAQPGPVCEGIETNSDVWSDSASSDPGTLISGSQATATQPAKQSRFGKLLSRAKGGSGSSAAAASTAVDQETAAGRPAEEDGGTVLPVMALSSAAPAAAPTRTGMRSMLFGRSRRQGSALPNTSDTVAGDSAEPPGTSWEAVEEEEAFLQQQQQQAQQHDDGLPSQESAWQSQNPDASDIASPAHANASLGSAAFVTPNSALLTTPSAAMTNFTPVNEAAEEAEVDPLSHRFEEHMLTSTQEPSHVKLQDLESRFPPAQQPKLWGVSREVVKGAPEHVRSRAASPSLSDHGSFDPLTATFEEFEAYNRSQEKHLNHLPEQLQAQLPDESTALSNQQLPQQQHPPTAGTSTQPRKTRSIPRIFRLRKTGSTANVTSTSTEAAAAASVEAASEAVPPSISEVDPIQAGGPPQGTSQMSNTDQGAALPKTRSKPFGLLRKRSKGTAQTLSMTQQLTPAAPAPSEAAHQSTPLLVDGTGGHVPQQGLLEGPPKQPLAEMGAEEPQHVSTVLALSAGLSDTFGSFMAASTAASPQDSPNGPRQVSHGSHDSEVEPDQLTPAAGNQTPDPNEEGGTIVAEAPSATWSYSEAVTLPPLQDTEAIPEHKGSFGLSVEEQGSFSTSLQVPDASAQHGLQAESAMPPKSNANGLAPEDVSVDMPGTAQSAAVASAPSASAEAFKSLWKMLSLKPSKPTAADATQPDLEAVRRQVSAQQALSRQVSEPAVIVAASDDQLKRPTAGDDTDSTNPLGNHEHLNSTPAGAQQYPDSTPVAPSEYDKTDPSPAAGVVTLPEENPDAADGIAKQPSSMAKRFGFLSTLRRGLTAAEGSSLQVAETPPDPPQDPPEQAEGAAIAQPDQSEGESTPLPAVEPAIRGMGGPQGATMGVQQGAALGVQHRPTQGADRGQHANPQLVDVAPIELPPVFEYGSEGEEAQNGQGSPATSGREGGYPPGPQDTGAVQYPSLPESASQVAPGYAAYPQVADVSQSPLASQQTELFMDYYSDVSRYDYQAADLGSMLEILACIKGVACLLQQANIWMSGYLYKAVYLQMQAFVQLALTHTDPRSKGYEAVQLLHAALGSPSVPQVAPAPPPTRGVKTFQKAKSLLSFRHQGSSAPAAASFAASNSMLSPVQPLPNQGEQQETVQVAPTYVQLLTLQYTAEQLIRSCLRKEEGKQWMKSVMDTESALSKDAKRFLSSSQSWEAVLDLSGQCQQAADLSFLWLKEIHLENTLKSHSQPLIHSVSWQLANHALIYPQERHIQVSVLPLEIYNDVEQLAAPALRAQHMVAEAETDAEMCLRKFITNLAAEAFMQYKAAAATHLTDWAFVKAQCPAPLPTSGVLRQFEELFRQHDLVLMGHSVDLSSTVACHVQGLFHSNAQYLVALCEASDITALVAVQAQVAVLQEAHAMLSCHLELDSWAETWAAADVQQAFDATTSRVAHAMTVHVIGDLLPNFAYCEPTHRFARMAPRQSPTPKPEADLPAFAYGPGGSTPGAFTAWAAIHENWVGTEHLFALLRLSGRSGIAMVVRAVTHHVGLLVQQPLLSALRPLLQNFPQLLLQAAQACSAETAAGLFGQLQYQVKQMLVLRSDWQAALPTLTQLGNALALITCLDCMLGNHADTAFMQLAPLLGITLGIGNHMQRMDEEQCTPFQAAVKEARGPESHAQAQQAEEIAWQECSMSSLMPRFLHTVQQALLPSLPELDYAPVKFCNAWSVLMFALASVDPGTTYAASRHIQSGTPAFPGGPPMQGLPHLRGAQQMRPVELSSYGDGLLRGAGMLLHLLNQTAWFKLTDLSLLVVQRQQLEYKSTGSSTQHQELATFLSKAQAASHVMDRTLSMLSSCTPQPPQAVSILTSTGGPAMQYAPDPCTFALPPVQTRAVMTEAQAQQDLAWQSTLTEQAETVNTAIVAAPISDALATQASRGFVYGKAPVAYSVAVSHESDSSLIPAVNTQWLHGEYSRNSLATSIT